ncbi:hypothetical protein [Pseudomonas putida]|uniref:hypothetical protein n=1 Tax=Pseudomonas putida TaxID=303 RepID=UPI0034659F85
MKKAVLMLALAAVSACSSHDSKVTSTDPNWLRIGDEPKGYPRTYIENINGNCNKVTETWLKGSYKDQSMWTKQQRRAPVACQ